MHRRDRVRAAQVAIDALGWGLATVAAFALRFDLALPADAWPTVAACAALFGGLKALVLVGTGAHRAMWRRFGFRDLEVLTAAVAAATGVAAAGVAAVRALAPDALPYATPGVALLDGALSLLAMLLARGVARQADEAWLGRRAGPRPKRVLLVGAGEAGVQVARELQHHPETRMRPVGFVDDDPAKAGRSVAGLPVLGATDDLDDVLAHERVDEVLITIPTADGRAVRRIVEQVRAADPGVRYRTIPPLHELLSDEASVRRLRDVGIDDLLRRPAVHLDVDRILGYLAGQRVLVTGAGGSIGSELVRQICRFAPASIVLLGHGENSIYQLERELETAWPEVRTHSVIAAVQNAPRLDHVFARHQPDVVFHTAAHKHVPLMELNPEEAVFNNVVGSRNLVETALRHGVTHFVNVSTDKAVHPTSVMGASKRIVEMLVEDAARRAAAHQVFVSVRFGNVLGSRGSAVPLFQRQIAAGGPVTVTHPDMVRYFMTIPEAAQLVLQASAVGRNGEIYLLDMGEPVRVLDLVKDLIRLSGLEPDVDVPIVFTGMRPGEKLREELATAAEHREGTAHPKIQVVHPHGLDGAALAGLIDALAAAALRSDGDEIRRLMGAGIPGSHLSAAGSGPDRPGAARPGADGALSGGAGAARAGRA